MLKEVLKSQRLIFFIFVFFMILMIALGCIFDFKMEDFESLLDRFPRSISGTIFVVLYSVLTILIWVGPKDILRILAAMYYGPVVSAILVTLGEYLNCAGLFFLSRKLGKEFVAGKMKVKYGKLYERLGEIGFWDIVAMRAIVLVPFRAMDLSMGLTKIPFRRYLWPVLLGSPFRIFANQLVMYSIFVIFKGESASLVHTVSKNPMFLCGAILYLVASGILLFRLIKIARG